MDFEMIRSQRKTISIQITANGRILVRCPLYAPEIDIQTFVRSKESWIRKHLAELPSPSPSLTNQQLQELTRRAKIWFPDRVAYWAEGMGLSYGRITIRHQRNCWGSCSSKGNLNFNCVLMLVSEEMADYVIVHELCHLVQPNHSPAFWSLVEQTLPQFRHCRQWLKEHGPELIGRIP